jgi:hypothetical protein
MRFDGSKLKLKRADKHIRELNSVLTSYLNAHVFPLYTEKDPKTGRDNLRLKKPTEPIPGEVPLILGDAIHNIRSALDYMMWDMITAVGGKPSRYTQLPFRQTRDELIDTMKGGLNRIPTIYDFILNDVRPYKSGNPALWGLHNLDIVDKHKLLIPTVSQVGFAGISATTATGGVFRNINILSLSRAESSIRQL